MSRVVLLLALLNCLSSRADVEVSIDQADRGVGSLLVPVRFLDENDQSVPAASMKGPTLLVPLYTQCTTSCPLAVARLKETLSQINSRDFNVILFDFAHSSGASEEDFRRALQIPQSWQIYHADKNDTQILLDSIGFKYMSSATSGSTMSYVHPSVIVVLSPERRIVKFIRGINYSTGSLDDALRDAAKFTMNASENLVIAMIVGMALLVGAGSSWARGKARELRHNAS